jgi:hypothetical protein
MKHQYLVVGVFVWGKGQTQSQAMKNCAKQQHRKTIKGNYRAYRLQHEETYVMEYGGFEYPNGFPPIPVEERISGIMKKLD